MDYVRTDEEIAHQRTYEAREAANHGSVTIHYQIVEGVPPPDPVVRKVGWRVLRRIGGVTDLPNFFSNATLPGKESDF